MLPFHMEDAMSEDLRAKEYGIPEAAIRSKMVDMSRTVSTSESEIRAMAIRRLCDAVATLVKSGATITW